MEQLLPNEEQEVFINYPEKEVPYQGQPYLVDEFGGIKWDPETQDTQGLSSGQNLTSWGYGDSPESLDEFYQRLEKLVKVIGEIPYIKGYCYTQLTDVEQEKNGLFYYDRRPKFDAERLHEIFKTE